MDQDAVSSVSLQLDTGSWARSLDRAGTLSGLHPDLTCIFHTFCTHLAAPQVWKGCQGLVLWNTPPRAT
ncbi:hypothetical protein GQ53DRAFT_370762 [Thozetella sp. PMI_491]|nr:hypothetical protein GQ53DRAFT_370762 [Thozetella sp. PMI_491]